MNLPKSFTIYNVLGLVGKHFNLPSMLLRLVWEAEEEAVVASGEETNGDDWDHEGVKDTNQRTLGTQTVLKEETLVPLTRNLGTWIDGNQAKIRVEWSEENCRREQAARDLLRS